MCYVVPIWSGGSESVLIDGSCQACCARFEGLKPRLVRHVWCRPQLLSHAGMLLSMWGECVPILSFAIAKGRVWTSTFPRPHAINRTLRSLICRCGRLRHRWSKWKHVRAVWSPHKFLKLTQRLPGCDLRNKSRKVPRVMSCCSASNADHL